MSSRTLRRKNGFRRSLVVLSLAGTAWLGFLVMESVRDAGLREAGRLLDRDEFEQAQSLVTQWERDHGSTGHSQALQARALVGLGRHHTALRIFEQIGAADFAELHAWATAYLSLQQWSQALPLLQGLVDKAPQDPDLLHELAACQAQLGMYDEALRTAESFRATRHMEHRALLLIGSMQLKRGNNAEALTVWSQISQHDPTFTDLQLPPEEFLTQFAGLQIEQGNVSKADELLRQSLKIQETAEAWFQYGLVADQQGNTAESAARWLKAIQLNPKHLNARESLARREISKGSPETALTWVQPILNHKPVRSSTAYLMQRIFQLKNDTTQSDYWQEQLEKLRLRETMDSTVKRVLTENPDSYWAHVIRSYQFAEQGNVEQAKRLLEGLKQEGEDSFVTDLRKAVESGSNLPDKDRLPINLF